MQKQKNRIIIDTNLWISFLLTKDFSKFDAAVANKQFTLLFSEELIDEFIDVIQRTKFRKYFTVEDTEALLTKINEIAIFVKVTSNINACRDFKDNFLLSLAVDGKATHLITGDKDLLILKKINNTAILTISEYLELIN